MEIIVELDSLKRWRDCEKVYRNRPMARRTTERQDGGSKNEMHLHDFHPDRCVSQRAEAMRFDTSSLRWRKISAEVSNFYRRERERRRSIRSDRSLLDGIQMSDVENIR